MNLLTGTLTGFIAFIILLPIVVFVHEFGHFLFARINGVRVEAFSIGFGKPILSWIDRHNTVWKICIIPLGGYVKMLGQSDTPESTEEHALATAQLSDTDRKQSFEFKQRYQKASIVLAGPLFNFIFSFLIFFAIFAFKGIPNTPSKIVSIIKDSPAYTAGLKSDDIIVAINDTKINKPREVSQLIQSSHGSTIKMEILRADKTMQFSITPKLDGKKYILGLSYSTYLKDYIPVSPLTALSLAYHEIESIVTETMKSLGEMIVGSRSSKDLGGMISIAKVSGTALSSGFYSFIYLIAFISASLGLFNILPIPVLDGGYLFIYIIEGITRRELPSKIKEKMFLAGFIIIISLLLLSNINDIIRIIK